MLNYILQTLQALFPEVGACITNPLDNPMTIKIYDPSPEFTHFQKIDAIWWSNPESVVRVGHGGITEIVVLIEQGQLWGAVYREDTLTHKYNLALADVIEPMSIPNLSDGILPDEDTQS